MISRAGIVRDLTRTLRADSLLALLLLLRR
jgi:hypothetical protein